MTPTVTIDKALAQNILNYLFRQPYGEVFNFIAPLARACQPQAPAGPTVKEKVEAQKAKNEEARKLKEQEKLVKKLEKQAARAQADASE